jgi:hypothetical protein
MGAHNSSPSKLNVVPPLTEANQSVDNPNSNSLGLFVSSIMLVYLLNVNVRRKKKDGTVNDNETSSSSVII